MISASRIHGIYTLLWCTWARPASTRIPKHVPRI